MSLIDWLIVLVPLTSVMILGFYSRRYVHGVADFLSAGRCAGRYVLTMGSVANGLSIVGLLAYVEVSYRTGFAVSFWRNLLLPIGVAMGLYGYCTYRFRETRAMSLGQFLEMRYNRSFRIFAATLRTISEICANMIMPAVAARFFIYFLGLPQQLQFGSITIQTFTLVVIICMFLAISLICFGGTLAMLITDSVQGMVLFPLMAVFVVFILCHFSWTQEIIPVMSDRIPGESFLNSFDIKNMRDFNLVMIIMYVVVAFLHQASWIGAGFSTAAKSPHEQKMAGLLGTWRVSLNNLFYVLLALGIITLFNHQNFSAQAKKARIYLNECIASELVSSKNAADFGKRIAEIPEQKHRIGEDAPLSQKKDVDTIYMQTAQKALKEYEGETVGNSKFQQYRTLYYQQMLSVTMRHLLPSVILGLFCLLMVLAMISTDDVSIFSATITTMQDIILPFMKRTPTPKQHIWLLRFVAIGIGVIYVFGSSFCAQIDYINLFVTIMTMMWLGGCGPVMIFGLYSRFGNTKGAFSSLITGMVLAFAGIFLQRNWADIVYPWLVEMGWVAPVGTFLETVSKPLNPYVVWTMNPVKFPINSYEIYLLTMMITLVVYCGVSWLTQKKPFDLDRMLHRGIYGDEKSVVAPPKRGLKELFSYLIGITPQYSKWDKLIAFFVFGYSICYQFFLGFVAVVLWNFISPWPLKWWGGYFFITALLVPGIISAISTFWFGIGGVRDLFRLFRDLKNRQVNDMDNGQVEDSVSLADKALFCKKENDSATLKKTIEGDDDAKE